MVEKKTKKVLCPHCGKIYRIKEDAICPFCGSDNYGQPFAVHELPKTIEELKQWYKDCNLPDEEITRFFIGRNYTEPKAFGIYEENGEFIVYKNMDNGQRTIRYKGPNETFAVKVLYVRLKEEIINQKTIHGTFGNQEETIENTQYKNRLQDKPKTIEELKKWYVDCNLPNPYRMDVYIDKIYDRCEVATCGIYKLNDEYFVYQDNTNANHNSRRHFCYQGPDEKRAVEEFCSILEPSIVAKDTDRCYINNLHKDFARALRKYNAEDVPETIEELKLWCLDCNVPDEDISHCYIGRDIADPGAFGIFKEYGNYTVYQNEENGDRRICYHGHDEKRAVNILYGNVKANIVIPRKAQSLFDVENIYGSDRFSYGLMDVPSTVEKLKQWYIDCEFRDENITHFYIGKNVSIPGAFGIYEENGNYTAYRNKEDGGRVIFYQGKDEAHAIFNYHRSVMENLKANKELTRETIREIYEAEKEAAMKEKPHDNEDVSEENVVDWYETDQNCFYIWSNDDDWDCFNVSW